MIFYVSFALALLLPTKRARAACLSIGLGLLCAAGWLAHPANPILYTVTNPLLAEFLFGVAVAAIVPLLPSRPRTFIAVQIVAWLLLLASGHARSIPYRPLVVGIPAAILVFAAIALEPLFQQRPMAALREIGDASYALYLSHTFVLKACSLALLRLLPSSVFPVGGFAGFTIFLVIGLIACILFAVLIHEALEKPMTQWLNSLLGLRKRIDLTQLPKATPL